MTIILQWNTKGEMKQNVLATLFYIIKVDGNQGLSSLKRKNGNIRAPQIYSILPMD